MPIIFETGGLRVLQAQLNRAPAQAVALSRRAVAASGARLESAAKVRCPVDTGNLRNSISRTSLDGGLGVEVGPTASYGAFVELGTSRMRPQPYMGPATDIVEPQFVAAMTVVAGEALR